MKKPKFLYFDVGGVLLDYRRGHRRIAEQYNVPHQKLVDIFEANWRDACRGTLRTDVYMKYFAEALSLPQPYPDHAEFWTDLFEPIHETHALAKNLSAAYRLGILSNAEPGMLPLCRKKGLIPDLAWEPIVDSSEYKTIKPEDRIYEIAEALSCVPTEELFFIDDVPEHIDAVRKRGWQGMVFDWKNPKKSVEKLEKLLL